mgnify:CR=1 FL=1
MNNILSNLSVATLISVILLLIILLVIFLTIYFLDKYIFYFHEYGHILKIVKNLNEDKYDYEKDINTDIVIQVVEYTTFFNFITFKRKTYSNYFKYLENKKQESKYQSIIKDIAIGGYEFSKQLENYKSFHILHTIFIISATITIILLLLVVLVLVLFNTIFYMQPILNILVIMVIIFFPKKLYKLFYSIYKYMCKVGYGKKSINTHKKGMNDCYIHEYPNQFAYTNREEDKKHTKGKPKVLLDIVIDLNDIENIEPRTIYQNNIYRKIAKNFPLNNKIY